MSDIPMSVINWLAAGERGISSETIVQRVWGLPRGRWGWSHPLDPDDLQRCLKLLQESPETAARFHLMANVSREWKGLVEKWKELEQLFLEEVGSIKAQSWSAPRTYAAMQAAMSKGHTSCPQSEKP